MATLTKSDQLLTYPSDLETVITRVFNAPRALVFDAWTKPEHVRNWYGFRDHTMTVCEIDLRPGGNWRYVVQEPGGGEFAFSGQYIEVVPFERLVSTEGFEAMPGSDYVVTATFEERDGKTLLTSHLRYRTAADRNGHRDSGMEAGMRVTLARLDEQLEAMAADRAGREFVVSRVFAAPRALVFKAFTEPDRLFQWFGPRSWPLSFCEVDLRVGGTWKYCMTGPAGEQAWGLGIFDAIVEPSFLAYTDHFTDADGNISHGIETPDLPDAPSAPFTFEFAEAPGGTRVTVRALYGSAADYEKIMAMGMEPGWHETWDRLAEYLPEAAGSAGDRSIMLTREFDAPPALVFRAWTDPQQIGQWFGPDGCRIVTHEMDVRVGGVWRFTMLTPDGTDYQNRAEYIEVVEPERLVFDHGDEVDGRMANAFRQTVTFEGVDGRTRLTMRMVLATAEERAAAVAFGAIEIGSQTLRRLGAHLAQG